MMNSGGMMEFSLKISVISLAFFVGDDTIRCEVTDPWVTPLKCGQLGEIPERIRLKALAVWHGLSYLMTKKLILQ